MADETIPNRAELEYTARVNEPSFRQAREQVRRETEQTATEARQGTSATSRTGVDPELDALRREREERTRAIQERNNARIAEVNAQRSVSDEEFRIMTRLNTARNRADEQEIKGKQRVRDEVVKLAAEKAKAEEFALRSGADRNLLYPGVGPANFNLQAGYRSSLLARANTDELQAFRDATTVGGGGRGGFGGGAGFNRFAQRRAIAEAGYLFGAPELGQVGSLGAYGPGFAAVGIGLGAGAGIVESIKLANQLEKANTDLAASVERTGQSYSASQGNVETFRTTLALSREEAIQTVIALNELQIKVGNVLPEGKLTTIATISAARGLTPEQSSQAITQLAQGSTKAFEELSIKGQSADLVLQNYARSIGTTVNRLTDMQKAQALTNALLSESGRAQELEAQRLNQFSGKWQSFTASVKDFAAEYGQAFISRFVFLETAEATAQRRQNEEDARNKKSLDNQKARLEQEKLLNDQQAKRFQYEDYFAGRTRQNVEQQRYSPSSQLKELLEQRDLFQRERPDVLSPDDAKKFANQFTDLIDAATESAREKVISFSKTFRDQFSELAQLQLGEKQNPYVKLFADGELAAARAREQFALAGDAVVNEIVRAQKAMRDTEVYELRIKDNLTAVKLEFEAAQLSKPFLALTKEMKNTISVFQLELQAVTKGPELLFQARQIETGGYGTQPYLPGGPLQGFRGLELDQLRRLRARYAGEEGLGGEEIKHLLNQQYISLYKQLTPNEQQQVFQFGQARFDFSQAFRGEEAYGRRQIELQIERNAASFGNVRLAQQQLQELARLSEGQNRDVTRRAFLDVTGTLSREEITPDIIKGRAAALQEEARFTREREQRAQKAIESTEKFQAQVQANLQSILGAVQARNDKVIVEVLDRTDAAKISTLGQSF